MLRGRRAECDAIEELLDRARVGQSGALVLRGDAGIGKTALLTHAIDAASGFAVVRASGIESELDLAFAGLHQLCVPLLPGLRRLPGPQQEALETAFGLSAGSPPDRFFVGLAVLGLLSDMASERPLLCVVDDAQWIDGVSAQALAFVARRLQAESVVLLLATRATSTDELTGLPSVVLGGLSDADARDLLTTVIPGRVDERVRERIVAEAQGNPLALLELPRGSAPAELAGGFALLHGSQVVGRIEESFRQRLRKLPSDTQRFLALAAADSVGDPALVWRAAALLGLPAEAAAPAESDGLLELGSRVRFRHPLVRSAAYRDAAADVRRDLHRALADATDADADPERRAWHRAQASALPDESVAAELEHSAGCAQARGGLAAGAAFLERSASLTPDPILRAARALRAAEAKHAAGAPESALTLLALAEAEALDNLQLARAERLRAEIAFTQRRGSDAPPLLLRAARRLEPLDAPLALQTYRDALSAALFAGQRGAVVEAAEALRAAPRSSPPGPPELLMSGQALLIAEGHEAGMPVLLEALSAFRRGGMSEQDEAEGLPFACLVALSLWDDESWHALSSSAVHLARSSGALSALPVGLDMKAAFHACAGEFSIAEELVAELEALADAMASATFSDASLLLTAWSCVPTDAEAQIAMTVEDAARRGEETTVSLGNHAAAILNNGLGRYDRALAAALESNEHHAKGGSGLAQPELIEAAIRCGEPQHAVAALQRLSERTRVANTPWGSGVEARARALLHDDADADRLYVEAIEALGRTRMRTDLARARLLYGEWLRRERRRVEAREQLRAAYDEFTAMGAMAFAERAARELLAGGERARRRTPDTRGHLTAQEAQIARLARDGLSNSEIGARLFISPRTVEYHLHKVFTKLAISSRTELDRALPAERPQQVQRAGG
jgi:DNA-binding NarL/FixJ family response regulator